MALDSIEPFGDRRADIQAATICATLVNLQRKKGRKAATVDQFLLDYWQEPAPKLSLLDKIAAVRARIEGNGNTD
jgi:hypothetical protein